MIKDIMNYYQIYRRFNKWFIKNVIINDEKIISNKYFQDKNKF